MPRPSGLVYILASKQNGTLYIGITSDLHGRVRPIAKVGVLEFCKKYNVTHLVYFEEYTLYVDAIRRETNLKRWKRAWKIALIEKVNPNWDDLIEKWHA